MAAWTLHCERDRFGKYLLRCIELLMAMSSMKRVFALELRSPAEGVMWQTSRQRLKSLQMEGITL